MIGNFTLAGVAAAALLMTAASLQSASAVSLPQTGIENAGGVTLVRRGGGRGFGGFRGPRGPRFHGVPGRIGRPHYRPRFYGRRGIRIYPRSFYYGGYLPYAPYYYYDDVYTDGPCDALRRRAERTGSRTWWNRYRRCVRRYD